MKEPSNDPRWYQRGVIYQVHVRSFFDSNDDGVGDFPGLTQKLDYIQDLGVSAIWLLPFYPSPLKDDGYDISDYTQVNPIYGTLDDFTTFLDEAHRRGLYVITELVLNHTSDQHEWFQRSRRAPPESYWRNFYVWSENPDKYPDARIIFKDFEPSNWSWDPIAKSYFWHRFYSHQPDLNYDNPVVHEMMLKAVDFWFERGVDGMRLDAIPYLYEREGTTCENLPETHAFLKKLRSHIDSKFQDKMLLAEANQWPEDAVTYFGDGDECNMVFHFPLMPRMFMAIAMEDRFPVVDILDQTPPLPVSSQWASFLRNHDELTLETVTDEDRDYMYRAYALDPQARVNSGIRRRLAPLLGNDRRKIELINLMLFTLPGTPTLYYGDEIGMGDNIYLGDRNGVRTPMQWRRDRNAGFSGSNPQQLHLPVVIDPEYHYESINVESQQGNSSSLLWWMKRLVSLRQQLPSLQHGNLTTVLCENRHVLAYVREFGDETTLVVVNLSRLPQYAELDLKSYVDYDITDLFGQSAFGKIKVSGTLLTLSPFSYYLFKLEKSKEALKAPTDFDLPILRLRESFADLVASSELSQLNSAIQAYLQRSPYFRGPPQKIRHVQLEIMTTIKYDNQEFYWLTVATEYFEGEPEDYSLPIGFLQTKAGAPSTSAICWLADLKGVIQGQIFDASTDPAFVMGLLLLMQNARPTPTTRGTLTSHFARPAFVNSLWTVSPIGLSHPHTNLQISDQFVLKLFRKLDRGLNPDIEITRHLNERQIFANSPPYYGSLEEISRHDRRALAILRGYVPSDGDAWTYTVDFLGTFFEQVMTETAPPALNKSLLLSLNDTPPYLTDTLAVYFEAIECLAQTTAHLHTVLAEEAKESDFHPEGFTDSYQQSIYQTARQLLDVNFYLLQQRLPELSEFERDVARELLPCKKKIVNCFYQFAKTPIRAKRTRVHGHLQLESVLHVGRAFMVMDFEGDFRRSTGQRRLKHSPLVDVVSLIRSLHYAASAALHNRVMREEDREQLRPWARYWASWAPIYLLRSYLNRVSDAKLLPEDPEQLELLLNMHLMDRGLRELGTTLTRRPEMIRIALLGLMRTLSLWPA